MSTYQDHGAYTPPSEPPLSFDAREPVRGSGPMPTTLLASVVLLAVVAGGGVMFLRHGGDHAAPSSGPVMVGAPAGQTRAAAPAAAQPVDPTAGLQIYRTEAPQPTAPVYVAPPETPTPRQDAPPPQIALARIPTETVTLTPPPAPTPAPSTTRMAVAGRAPQPQLRVTEAPAIARPAPAMRPDISPSSPSRSAGDPIGALAQATAQPAPRALPRPSAGGAGTSVQIGAFSSSALAEQGWNDAARIAPGLAAGRDRRIEPVEVGDHTLYRTFMTGFSSHEAAVAFCDQLRAGGKACFVR